MAEIRPFRAFRYNPEIFPSIGELTSPLFDVVSKKQRDALYKNRFNSIHLSVPSGENPTKNAAETLQNWLKEGIIVQDEKPCIYAYYQYFAPQGSSEIFCRKGFIAYIRAYDWQENVILRHENTIPKAVNDRTELLETLLMHTSPTHGLYEDVDFMLERYTDEAIKTPIYEVEDHQGVRDVLAKIDDEKIIKLFIDEMSKKNIILADGHHRYESSVFLRKKMQEKHPEAAQNALFNYHLMYFTNVFSNDLRILPTHRIFRSDMSEETFLEKCREFFYIRPVEDLADLEGMILNKKWCFGVIKGENAYSVKLKPDAFPLLSWDFPDVVKRLDLTVLHFFVFEKIFGVKGKDQRACAEISFERNFTKAAQEAAKGDFAFIVNEVRRSDVLQVCKTGYTMPQKSTYFYPKVVAGFVFGSIREENL
jgi:uncharacterized protein (DUF1015 family)